MNRIDTLIELYDPDTHLYNALGVMLFNPRRVIFLIPEHCVNIYEKYKTEYKNMWENHGCCPEKIISVLTGTSDMLRLSETILQFCGEYTVLDVEGGTPELYLAAGYVCGKYPSGLRCIRINFRDEKITEYKYNGSFAESSTRSFTEEEADALSISVEESIRIYGGEISGDSYSELIDLGMTKEDIIKDAFAMWETVYNVAGRDWNDIVPDRIHSSFDSEKPMIYTDPDDRKRPAVVRVIKALSEKNLISELYRNGGRIYYSCSSPLVFSCLRKAGEALELYTLSLALSIKGVKDARCGINIAFRDSEGSSENEVDCIYIRGSTPVFVSCKNGNFSSDELYKFHTVSEQFGGKEKISILIAPNFRTFDKRSQNLIERAELYKIDLITEFGDNTDKEMSELLRAKTDARKKKLPR